MAWRFPSIVAAARGALWTAAALVALFFGLVALYAVVDPVSTLMLARTVTGRPTERIAVSLDDGAGGGRCGRGLGGRNLLRE